MRLKDKVAIITAAGSGSGRAGAIIFAREGAKVMVGDIDPKGGKETVKLVQEAGGGAKFLQIDCGKVGDMRRLIDTTIGTYGQINILWNHAGIPGPGILEETEEAEFDRAMSVNIKGGFFAAKFAAPYMKKAGGGAIIFTASTSALRGSPWSPSYSLAKGGLIALVMSLAVHLGPDNIRTNCICPAGIDTPMLRVFTDRTGQMEKEALEKVIKNIAERSPIKRLATPEDIAYLALFLASDESSYINGVAIPVDGGKIARY